MTETVSQKLKRLADQWERETMNLSNPNAIMRHPNVAEIIAIGPSVVPWILDRMGEHPWFWMDALRRLTGDDPVTLDMHGNMKAMTDAWVQWGKDHFDK